MDNNEKAGMSTEEKLDKIIKEKKDQNVILKKLIREINKESVSTEQIFPKK